MKIYHQHRQFVQKMTTKTDEMKQNDLVDNQLYLKTIFKKKYT